MVFGWIEGRENVLPILYQVINLVIGDGGSAKGGIVNFDNISENFLGFIPVSRVPVNVDLYNDLSYFDLQLTKYDFIIISMIVLLITDFLSND